MTHSKAIVSVSSLRLLLRRPAARRRPSKKPVPDRLLIDGLPPLPRSSQSLSAAEGNFKTAVMESTETGSGHGTPTASLSRAIRISPTPRAAIKEASEIGGLQKNNRSVVEVTISNEHITSPTIHRFQIDLNHKPYWMALAKTRPKPKNWKEMNPVAANKKLCVLIPPPTSGTRDAWERDWWW